MAPLIDWLQSADLWLVSAALLAENTAILLLAVAIGGALARVFANRRVSAPAPPLKAVEMAFAATTLALNTGVTMIGLLLWRAGVVRFRTDSGLLAFADVLALIAIMDAAMYGLHRLAHVPVFYRLLHRPHHRYDRPRPLTLFVLSPPETLAFGALWLSVISVYPTSWLGMSLYLALNVAFGTIGHLGVEPFPNWWMRAPVLRWLANGGFHARHHADERVNLGFYTAIWDRLFGTLAPDDPRALPTAKSSIAAK